MKNFRDQFGPTLKPNFKITHETVVVNGEDIPSTLEIFGGLYEQATKLRGLSFDPCEARYIVRGDNKKTLGLYLGEIWNGEAMVVQLRDAMPMFSNELNNK